MEKETEYVVNEEDQVRELLWKGEILQIEEKMKTIKIWTVSLVILRYLIKVFRTEVEHQECNSIFDYSVELDELKRHFIKVKLLLRRLDFDLTFAEQMEFYDYCAQTKVSQYLIEALLRNNVIYKEKVCMRLIEIYTAREGGLSEKVQYFKGILQSFGEKKNG